MLPGQSPLHNFNNIKIATALLTSSPCVHFQLRVYKSGIDAARGHKLIVGAHFGNTVIVDNHQSVGIFKSRKPVCYRKCRPSVGKTLQCLLDQVLTLGIKARRSLIQDKYTRIVEDGSCYSYTLSLTAGKIEASFT